MKKYLVVTPIDKRGTGLGVEEVTLVSLEIHILGSGGKIKVICKISLENTKFSLFADMFLKESQFLVSRGKAMMHRTKFSGGHSIKQKTIEF